MQGLGLVTFPLRQLLTVTSCQRKLEEKEVARFKEHEATWSLVETLHSGLRFSQCRKGKIRPRTRNLKLVGSVSGYEQIHDSREAAYTKSAS